LKQFILKAGSFYLNSFRNPGVLGKKLFVILFIKLFIMFAILKIFFFQDFLSSRFSSEEQKSEYVINSLTKQK
jgi:hypothetical protein